MNHNLAADRLADSPVSVSKPMCKGNTAPRYDGQGSLLVASRPCKSRSSRASDFCAQHDPVRKRRAALEHELAARITLGRSLGISYDRLLDGGASNDKPAEEVGAEMLRLQREVIGQRRAAYAADPEVAQLASQFSVALPDDLFVVLAEQATTVANVREGLRLAAYAPQRCEPWQLQAIVWAWSKAGLRKLAAHEPAAACILLRDLASPDKGCSLKEAWTALTGAFSPEPKPFASRPPAPGRPRSALSKPAPVSAFQSWKASNTKFLAALKEYASGHADNDFIAQLVGLVDKEHRALSARQVEVAREIMSRPEPRLASTQSKSIVFEIRALFRGELQDTYPDLTSDDLHVLEALTSDALYDRTSANYLWVSPGLATPDYLARRTRLLRGNVEIALQFLQDSWLIDSDGRRFTIEPLAVKFLGSDRVGEVTGSVVSYDRETTREEVEHQERVVRKYEAQFEACL